MTVIYQTTITHIGACAAMALEEQMLITFREGAPADIEGIALFTTTASLPARCSRAQSCSLASCATGDRRRRRCRAKSARAGPSPCALTATATRSFRDRPRRGPGAGRHRHRLRTEICCLTGEKDESGCCCHWRWTNLRESFCAAGWPPRATAWRWSIFRAKKPAASPGD